MPASLPKFPEMRKFPALAGRLNLPVSELLMVTNHSDFGNSEPCQYLAHIIDEIDKLYFGCCS